MSISLVTVRSVLRTRVLTAIGLPSSSRRAWENWNFDPTINVNTAWIRETLVPGQESPLSTGGLLVGVGFIQYDLFAPKGKGTDTYETIRDNIKAVFEPGLSLPLGNGYSILINSLFPLGNREPATSPWVGFPLQIIWEVHGARA